MLRNAGEEPFRVDLVTVGAHHDLVVRARHDREIGGQRIYSQIVAPLQLDARDGAREILNRRCGRGAIWELQMAVRSHEELRTLGEVPPPGSRAFLGDVVSHGTHESSHMVLDLGLWFV